MKKESKGSKEIKEILKKLEKHLPKVRKTPTKS